MRNTLRYASDLRSFNATMYRWSMALIPGRACGLAAIGLALAQRGAVVLARRPPLAGVTEDERRRP